MKTWSIVVGKGRPWQLLEGTEKAFEVFGIEPWRKGRGNLRTRCATHLLWKKFKRLENWECVREGQLGDKQVDLLLRDPLEKIVAVEVAGNADHEKQNLLSNLKNGGEELRKHVVIALDRSICEEVKKKLSSAPELFVGDVELEVLTLAQALKDDWNPR